MFSVWSNQGRHKTRLQRIPKSNYWYIFYHRSEGKTFVAKFGNFLEKEFLSKEVSGRKVEFDEVTVPAPQLESSSSQKSVPVTTTPISEEANDDDHVTSDKLLPNLVGKPE